MFSVPDHPKDGGIVAVLPGSDKSAKPMLLLGHLDVVEAKREDWVRDPFKLIEEDGYYYARGTVDDKAMAAVWADSMIRFKTSGCKPKRTIKLALTCGEETTFAFNGAQWLAANKPDLIAAEFALNEGAAAATIRPASRSCSPSRSAKRQRRTTPFETTNPAGTARSRRPTTRSTSWPTRFEAVRTYEFPVKFTDTTRAFFGATAAAMPGPVGDAINRLLANPDDKAADALISRDKAMHSTLRTTCVATLVNAGHAENALPQRATANVNCRIFPGETVEATFAKLKELAGPRVKVTINQPVRPTAIPPSLDPKIVGPAKAVAAKYFPACRCCR